MLRKFYLRLLGYKIHVPFVHPLQHRARKLEGQKRAYLDAQIAKHRDLEHARRERCYSHPAVKALGSMDGFIGYAEMAVDRAFYNAGL